MSDENSAEVVNPDQPIGDPEWGYSFNFSPGPREILHEFAGDNDIEGALCPHCQTPLTRLLSLDSEDQVLRLDPSRLPVVHLLYCWTCSIPFGEFCYRINDDGSIHILRLPPRLPKSEHGLKGPYDGYTGVFPRRKISLHFLDAKAQGQLRRWWQGTDPDTDNLGKLAEPRHQLGGFPFIYNPVKTECPECKQDMPLFAAICNDATGNNPWNTASGDTFVDNGGVQMIFHLCRTCSIVSAYHSCD
jgi:hypothetical protein